MSSYRGTLSNTGEKEFQLLVAAGLLRRFDKISDQDFYDRALKCFDALLDIRDSIDTAKKISAMIDLKATTVQKSAEIIIDRLLSNRNGDPYLSLGLPRDAGSAEAAKRWRRLIVLYHPDKYPDKKEYEEKAKRLNEAYDQIRKEKRCTAWYRPFNDALRDSLPKTAAVHRARYLRYLPTIILALTVLMAAISIFLFFKIAKDDRPMYNKYRRELSRPAAGAGLQIPSLMRHDFTPSRAIIPASTL